MDQKFKDIKRAPISNPKATYTYRAILKSTAVSVGYEEE
jgi:hypothetical protein